VPAEVSAQYFIPRFRAAFPCVTSMSRICLPCGLPTDRYSIMIRRSDDLTTPCLARCRWRWRVSRVPLWCGAGPCILPHLPLPVSSLPLPPQPLPRPLGPLLSPPRLLLNPLRPLRRLIPMPPLRQLVPLGWLLLRRPLRPLRRLLLLRPLRPLRLLLLLRLLLQPSPLRLLLPQPQLWWLTPPCWLPSALSRLLAGPPWPPPLCLPPTLLQVFSTLTGRPLAPGRFMPLLSTMLPPLCSTAHHLVVAWGWAARCAFLPTRLLTAPARSRLLGGAACWLALER
jgi:hypothetical protein